MTQGSDRRAARREQRRRSSLEQIPFRPIKHWMPPVEMLSAEQLEQIHDTSMRILEEIDRKSTRLNSSHLKLSRMPSSA